MFNGIAEKLIAIFENIVKWIFESLLEPFLGLSQLKDLVFGKTKEGNLVWGTFHSSDLTDALGPLMNSMYVLSGFFIVAFIVLYGMRISAAPLNPQKRNEMLELFKDLLVIGVVFMNLPTLYDLLFTINNAIVGLFNGAYESQLDSLSEEKEEDAAGLIGFIFIQLVLLGLMLWANFYYMMRKVTLIILMGMGPLMLAFWLNPQTKPITSAWLKELTGSVFVQAIHAFVFWTVATISATSNGFVETVIVYIIFIPISESVRKLLGMGGEMQGGLSKAGAMLGMGALAGMYGSVKGAIGDKSVAGALKAGYEGIKHGKGGNSAGSTDESKDTMGSMAGSDTGTTPNAEKMLKAGDILGRGGKAVFGMAGAVAGSPMGPVSSIMGATAGSAVGGAVGGLAGRVGASTLQGLANRNKMGIAAFKNGGLGRNGDGFEENLANEIADRETANWANDNRDAVMGSLRERFPDASKQELEGIYSKMQADKRAGFYTDAKSKFANAQGFDGKMASGSHLVSASSEAMANRWGEDNQASFFAAYDQNNPKLPGESESDYQTRRMNAFKDKKAQMRSAFTEKGNQVLSSLAFDSDEPLNKKEFQSHLSSAISGMDGVGSVQSLSQAAEEAISHVQGENVLQGNGKPNGLFLASRMANVKTQQMEQEYTQNLRANGMSAEEAKQSWNSRMPAVHQENLKMYSQSAEAADGKTFASGILGSSQRIADVATRAGDYLAAGSGARGFIQATSNIGAAAQNGVASANSAFMVSTDFGKAGFASHLNGVKVAATEGIRGTMDSIVQQNGGPVEAQANLQNSAAYASGMLLGAKGYQVGKAAVARFSPIRQQVQDQIKAPSEVIQMANTITDQNGNRQIAPGAVRQVITPTESYIEVRGKSGETQIVSRKGAGHSGLRNGDVIYQDLTAQDDSLVVASPKGGGSSTYRLDSGGGRVPSSIEVPANPNELLGSPRISAKHRPAPSAQLPSFSQSVDSGQFFVEDLRNYGMDNVQVVVEKGRQFVSAQKDGVTYRVSPIYAGDSKINGTETVQIPVSIKNNQLVPAHSIQGSIAVNSSVSQVQKGGYVYPDNPTTPYFSSDSLTSLMVSKAALRAQRGVDKRRELDMVRRKQGLLG